VNPHTDEWKEHERRDRKAHPTYYRWLDRVEGAGGIIAIVVAALLAIGFFWDAAVRTWEVFFK
jgi:hypothetical protein